MELMEYLSTKSFLRRLKLWAPYIVRFGFEGNWTSELGPANNFFSRELNEKFRKVFKKDTKNGIMVGGPDTYAEFSPMCLADFRHSISRFGDQTIFISTKKNRTTKKAENWTFLELDTMYLFSQKIWIQFIFSHKKKLNKLILRLV